MIKNIFLKTGQILGPIFSISIAFILLSFFKESSTSNHEVIGYGMLLPIYVLQLAPFVLGYTLTTAVTTFVLYKQKNKESTFLSVRGWKLLYEVNFACTFFGLAIIGVPFLLLVISFVTFVTFE